MLDEVLQKDRVGHRCSANTCLCCLDSIPAPPGPYSSRSIILKPWLGKTIYVPLNEDGFFHAEVKVGTYQATLSDCVFLGCDSSLPRTVEVKPGETTVLHIDIDTGIR